MTLYCSHVPNKNKPTNNKVHLVKVEKDKRLATATLRTSRRFIFSADKCVFVYLLFISCFTFLNVVLAAQQYEISKSYS